MSASIPPSLETIANVIADPFRFTYALTETAAVNLIRDPGETYTTAQERMRPALDELCKLGWFKRVTLIGCTRKYLDLDDNRRRRLIQRPLSVQDCVEIAVHELWQPFAAQKPVFAPQSFLLPAENTHELLPDRRSVPFNHVEIERVLRESERENARLVEEIHCGVKRRRKSAEYDIGNAEQRVEFQAFNHLMYSIQVSHYVGHPRTANWLNTAPAPDYYGTHAHYVAHGLQVGVIYVANLSPKALAYFTAMQLRSGEQALDLIW